MVSPLVVLSVDKPVVFVGDTHGDLLASKEVFRRFSVATHRFVFLGDYVDRGADSMGNLLNLLEMRKSYPDSVTLLMGNHEFYPWYSFKPADFWESLTPSEMDTVTEYVRTMPMAAIVGDIFAVHSGPPDVSSLDYLINTDPYKKQSLFMDMLWSDLVDDASIDSIDDDGVGTYARGSFAHRMKNLGASALVRGHNPFVPVWMFRKRCLTLMTCRSYDAVSSRRVGLWVPGKKGIDLIYLGNE